METIVRKNGNAAPDAAAGTRPRFARWNTDAMMRTTYPSLRWVVPGYVPEGLTLLAGRQKLGKSWLAMDLAIAVASGGSAMGSVPCEQGDVLYIDQENGPRRIQRRIASLFPESGSRPDMSRIEWTEGATAFDDGFVAALDEWRGSVRKPWLVVIDALPRIRPAGPYKNHDMVLAALQSWATAHGIAVVVLSHTKKGGAALSAHTDTTLALGRDHAGFTLHVHGRDVEEKENALTFAAGCWTLGGDAAELRRSAERTAILTALEQAGQELTPSDIAAVTGMKGGNVRRLLFSMVRAKEVTRTPQGRYRAGQPEEHSPVTRIIYECIDPKTRNVTKTRIQELKPWPESVTGQKWVTTIVDGEYADDGDNADNGGHAVEHGANASNGSHALQGGRANAGNGDNALNTP